MSIDKSFRDWLKDYFGVKDDGSGAAVNVNVNGGNHKFIFPGSGTEFVRHMSKKGVIMRTVGDLDSPTTEFFIMMQMPAPQ